MRKKAANKKKFLCAFGHGYMIVRSITMMKKFLHEKRDIPMRHKEDGDYHKLDLSM